MEFFTFDHLKPNAYTEEDLRLAERVGNQIAGAIANRTAFCGTQANRGGIARKREEIQGPL